MKKTTLLVMLLLGNYYAFSLADNDMNNLQAPLDSPTNIRLSKHETGVVLETHVHVTHLKNDKTVVKIPLNNPHHPVVSNAIPNGHGISAYKNSYNTICNNDRLWLTIRKSKFRHYSNAGHAFADFILGKDPRNYFC